MIKKKYLISAISLGAICLAYNSLVFNERPGFEAVNIALREPSKDDNQSAAGLDESRLQGILHQSYTYLAHGKQAFAFESADGRYVLKFIKTQRVRPKKWFCYWQNWFKYATPQPIIKHFLRQHELQELYSRFRVACRDLHQETQILYVHTRPTSGLSFCNVVDRKGADHQIDLDHSAFVLQRKVMLVPQYIDSLLSSGDIEGAKDAVLALKMLLVERTVKGFTDEKQVFSQNYGFSGNIPIQLDIGKIRRLVSGEEQKELARICINLKNWVSEHYPVLSDSLN